MERKCQEYKFRSVNLVDLFGNWPFIQPDAQLNINEKTFNKIVLDQLFEFRNDLLVKICNPIHLSVTHINMWWDASHASRHSCNPCTSQTGQQQEHSLNQ